MKCRSRYIRNKYTWKHAYKMQTCNLAIKSCLATANYFVMVQLYLVFRKSLLFCRPDESLLSPSSVRSCNYGTYNPWNSVFYGFKSLSVWSSFLLMAVRCCKQVRCMYVLWSYLCVYIYVWQKTIHVSNFDPCFNYNLELYFVSTITHMFLIS